MRQYQQQQARPATDAQIDLIEVKLADERDIHPAVWAEYQRQKAEGMTTKQASAWITVILGTQKVKERPNTVGTAFSPTLQQAEAQIVYALDRGDTAEADQARERYQAIATKEIEDADRRVARTDQRFDDDLLSHFGI